MAVQMLDVVKRRQDREDPEKVYWDPIGTLFIKDGEVGPDTKIWMNIFAIGDVMAFPRKERDHDKKPEKDKGGFRY